MKKADGQKPQAEYAGTLLAQEPPDIDPKKPSKAESSAWQQLRGSEESDINMLRQWQNSWFFQSWNNLAAYINPRRSLFLTQNIGNMPSPNNMNRGRPINNMIVDPTGTYAVRVCAAGLMSGLASPSRPWFKIMPKNQSQEIDSSAREWLDEVESRLYTVLAGSNFYNSFYQECEDNIVFGTAPVIIYEDPKDVIRCYNPVVGEYFLSSSSTMRVDGMKRLFLMTIKQIVEFFGLDNCPAEVVKLWKDKGSALQLERIVAHSIGPNYGVGDDNVGRVKGNFPWKETYWMWGMDSERPLSMKGFYENPFTASRWSTQSNDAYGRSVGMDVLPDIVQLQVETMRKAEAIEKQVRPPLVADMTLKNQPSSILPGHVTYVPGLAQGGGMRPIYEVQPDISAMSEDLKEIQQRIQRGFFNDLFLMLEQLKDQKITAYEVAQKMQEKLQVLGPVIENLISESLRPRLYRVFAIMKRKGFFPVPPPSMQGQALDIQFVSMLVLAQKAAATGGIERIIALVGNMAGVYPDVKDNIDPDEVVREMSDMLGNPQKIIRGMEKVKKMRAVQAQQAQQMQQQQQMAHGAAVAKTGADAAQVLSNTKVGGASTALGQLLGQGNGP